MTDHSNEGLEDPSWLV